MRTLAASAQSIPKDIEEHIAGSITGVEFAPDTSDASLRPRGRAYLREFRHRNDRKGAMPLDRTMSIVVQGGMPMAVATQRMRIAAVIAAIAGLMLSAASAYSAPSESVLEVGDTCGTSHSISGRSADSNDANEGETEWML